MARRGRGGKRADYKRAFMPSSPTPVDVTMEHQNDQEQQIKKRKIDEIGDHCSESELCFLPKNGSPPLLPKKRSKIDDETSGGETPLETTEAPTSVGLNDMPNEVLAYVFSCVSFDDMFTLEKVCRRFNFLMKTVVWKKIHTVNHKQIIHNTDYPEVPALSNDRYSNAKQIRETKRHKITDRSVKIIFSRADIVKLDLSVYSRTLTYQLVNGIPAANRLNYLNLSHIRLTNSSLRTIGNYCPLLEKVAFEQCFSDGSVEKGLEVLFTKCSKMRYLNFADNNKLDGESFKFIPESVTYLNLAGCYNIPVSNMDTLTSRLKDSLRTFVLENYENARVDQINQWMQKLKRLKKFELASWFSANEDGHLDFSSLEDIETLKLSYNFLLTSEGLKTLQHCKNLRVLDISYCVGIGADVLPILKKCKTLIACRLDGWKHADEDIIDFVNFTKLRALSLYDCPSLKIETIKRIVIECKVLEQFFTKTSVKDPEIVNPSLFKDARIRQRLSTHPCDINITIDDKASFCSPTPPNRLRLYHVRQKPEDFI